MAACGAACTTTARLGGSPPPPPPQELTKLHEDVFHGTAREAATWLNDVQVLGEFTVVVGGAPGAPDPDSDGDDRSDDSDGEGSGHGGAPDDAAAVEEAVAVVAGLLAQDPGLKPAAAIKLVAAATAVPRPTLYLAWVTRAARE